MIESIARFGIKIDKMSDDQWSFGICLSHWWKETYLFINLFKWCISVGWLLQPEKEETHA
jgi:hypothetical protein